MKRFFQSLVLFVITVALIAAESQAGEQPRIRSLNYEYKAGDELKRTYQVQIENGDPGEKLKSTAQGLIRKVVESPKAAIKPDPTNTARSLFHFVEPPPGEKFAKIRLYSLTFIKSDPAAVLEEQWWEYEVSCVGDPKRDKGSKEYLKGIFQFLIAEDLGVEESKLKLRFFVKSATPGAAPGSYYVRFFIVRSLD